MRAGVLLSVVVVVSVLFSAANAQIDDLKDWPIKEEICENFAECLSACVLKLPPNRQFTEILDCSDSCAASNCREVTHDDALPPRTAAEKETHQQQKAHPSNTDTEFGVAGDEENDGPVTGEEIRRAIASTPGIDRKQLLDMFRHRLTSADALADFKATTKKVAKLDRDTGILSV